MKKLFLSMLLAPCVLLCQSAAAQTDDNLVLIKPAGQELRLEVAGYGITLADRKVGFDNGAKSTINRPVRRVRWNIGLPSIEVGANMLANTNYGQSWIEDGDFLETKGGDSFHLAFEFIQLRVRLDQKSKWWLTFGMRGVINEYVFANKATLQRTDGVIHPLSIDGNVKKAKLSTRHLSIPIRIVFTPTRNLNIGLRASGDLLMDSYTKYKCKRPKFKHKEDISGLNSWSWHVGATISYKRIGLYADYSLTPLFKSLVGPNANAVSVGIQLGF